MALAAVKAGEAGSDAARLLMGGYSQNACVTPLALSPSRWPETYVPIRRIQFTSMDEVLEIMKPQSADGIPLIIEGSEIVEVEKWASPSFVQSLLKDKKVLVKKSATCKFRYFDLKKNIGKFDFQQPVEEVQETFSEFSRESEKLLEEGSDARMYLQETLSGHCEMAEEFATWKWELPIRISAACGWGLPDSNELFVGMHGAETPLHFDERENLFFQIRGQKEIVVFPFVDYKRLYPFPTTHPCDRQSMVGSPVDPDVTAFPEFLGAVGHFATLKAGDLLYLPYGWWHWLRNLEHMAMSISFWSTTPSTDFANGIPDKFTDHMLTRVKRNLESLIAQQFGPENLNSSMLDLKKAVESKEDVAVLQYARSLLSAVKLPPEEQDGFLLEVVQGRFGIDWNRYV
ncbi:unnamed protein product [Effrenium voratum]|uniref:JmjC domain-containing protein n=1 Tax=Effrenium voratum TaxID=2562239 RepID=A0AA36HR71_9DINO|nr:unnamed protein product [Effrenium voratum]CAJ1430487.1 unnamed protein product [Effrenium voratum]